MRSRFPSPGMRWARSRRVPTSCLRPLSLLPLLAITAAAAADAATVAGRVTDPDGRAVPNARVVVSGPLGTVAETRTTSAGDYELTQLPDGPITLRVLADGFNAPPVAVTLAGDERRTIGVQLNLSAIEEEIIVSASQIAVARSEAPASVTVITAADLAARQVETVADALRDVPGLSVTRSGGRGALTSLFPRGGASNYTLVLVDGVRVNSFGGAFDFAHLSVANIDRIEVVRGPQSALYGSEAIGAVVQVFTRTGGAPTLNGQIEAGSQATLRATLGTAGTRGRLSWGLGAERYSTDGFNGRSIRDVTGSAASAGSGAAGAVNGAASAVNNDDYARTTVTGTLAYRTPSGSEAGLTAGVARDERGFPGPWGSDPIGAFPGLDRVSRGSNDSRRLGGHVVTPWSARVRQRAEIAYTDLSSAFVSSYGPSSSGTTRTDARLQEDVALGRPLALSAGGEFVRERGRSTYVTGSASTPIPIDRRTVGLFGEARFTPNARLNVTGGLRLEQLDRAAVDADPFAFSPRPAFASQSVRSLNPKIAATWLLHGGADATTSTAGTTSGAPGNATAASTRLRASAGTGIRPPDVFEIAFTDNPTLQPERSRSVEVGVEQQLARGAVVLDAAWFNNRYDDLIVSIGRALGNASRWRTDNISNARARGLELSARTRLPHGFALSTTYTWLSTAILSVDGLGATAPPPFTVGDPLIRRPRHQGAVDLRYRTGRWSAFTALTSRGRMLDLEPNYGSFGGLFFTPGYAVLDVGGAVALSHGLELFGRVTNAANRRYEETLGYPALGRTGLVGVRIAAGH